MDRTVLIFGASSGIGLETAKLFVKENDIVYNVSRTQSNTPGIYDICADVSKRGAVSSAVESVAAERGSIDILVYSAGFSMAAPVEFVESKDYRYLYEVNFFGFIEAVKAAVPYMREAGTTGINRKIIAISSIGAVVPIIFDSYYSSSKAALNMLCETLKPELKPYGIDIMTIMPGGTKTDFTFKRKVYPYDTVGSYADALKNAVEALKNTEQSGMSPQEVAETIYAAATSELAPVTVSSGMQNKAVHVFSKIMPRSAVSYLSGIVFGV